jgi:hypothetical protein
MSESFMTRATRTPISFAATAGLLLGAVRASLFAIQGGRGLGDLPSARAGLIIYVGLMGFLAGAVTWWLFVARLKPAQTAVLRGVIIGALSAVISTAILPCAQLAIMVLRGLRTESVGNVMEAAGEGALYGVAGIAFSLLSGWMDFLAAMIVGGILVYLYRRGAGSVPSGQFPEREQAPSGRTRCDVCGIEYPTNQDLRAAGSRGYVCSRCVTNA